MIPEDAIWILELIRNRDARTEAEKDAVNAAIEALKAQLSHEGATSDTISRQAAIDALDDQIKKCCKALGSFSLSDVDTHAVKVEMASLRAYRKMLENLPTIQPVATDTNVGDTISRQAALEKVRSMQTYKLFMGDDMILVDKAEVQTELMMQPSVHPEPQEGEWIPVQRCEGDTQPDLECPFCKHRIGWWDMGRYCAGCGAKLKGGAG